MKTATVILSLYVLLLSVMPCPCERAYMSMTKHENGTTVSCDCGHGEGDVDLCTPFCVVSQCMHTPVVLFRSTVHLLPVVSPCGKSMVFTPQNKPTSMFRGSVWRPPCVRV